MLVSALTQLFTRDLNRLKQELLAYQDEQSIWLIHKNIANSAGNLCLHLIGNLNTYIGAELGKTGYVRNRPLEFSTSYIARAELIEKIEATIVVVNQALANLSSHELDKEYPQLVLEEKTTTGYLLVHLTTHLSYHLGQINYHRRLLDI